MGGLQAGNTFAVKDGDSGPQDNGHVVGLSNAGGKGTLAGPSVPGSPGDADVEPPTSLNGSTFAGTKGKALEQSSPHAAPKVPVTSSGGSKSKR